jgi:hypothetical protein
MQFSVERVKEQAVAAAAAWWADKPFPRNSLGQPYPCTACGRPITERVGTSLIGAEMRCPTCTEQYFRTGVAAATPTNPPAPPPLRDRRATPAEPVVVPAALPVRRRRGTWITAVVIVALIGLAVGLLVWAPWQKHLPAQPTGVTAVSTDATSIVLKWAAPTSGPRVDRYVIRRGGTEVGSVPGNRTSYVDNGLRPGVGYTYEIVAVSGSNRSPASDPVFKMTATPSPTDLKASVVTFTAVTLQWSPPPNSPAPDLYQINANGASLGTVPGARTSYRATDLNPGTAYRFQVVAVWGQQQSEPTPALLATTRALPLSAARLSGTGVPVQIKIVSNAPGATPTVGTTWGDTWTFTPQCTTGPCDVVLRGSLSPGDVVHPFRVLLARAGAVYSGQTTAHLSHCGTQQGGSTDVNDSVTVRITVRSAAARGGVWLVSRWVGTLTDFSPRVDVGGGYYCAPYTTTASLSSGG